MYYIVLGVIMLALGIFMVVCPRLATKKSMRDNPKAVSGIRKRGFFVIACGIAVIVIALLI